MLTTCNKHNQPIRIAIIGLGKMGQYHINAVNRLKNGEIENYYKGNSRQLLCRIELCGLCDSSIEKTAIFKDIPVYSNHKDLLSQAAPDIVIIATPTVSHYQIAKAALRNGANVFVEKPIVTSLKEFEELNRMAVSKKTKIMAGHIERYNPVSIKIRAILDRHSNASKSFEFVRVQPHSPRITDDIITDKLIHDLDLAMFFFGKVTGYKILDKQSIRGQVHQLRLRLEHENSSGEIFVSWITADETSRKVSVKYDDTVMRGDFLSKRLIIDQNNVDCCVAGWIEAQNNQIKDELFDFIMYCYGEETHTPAPLISLEQIKETVSLLENISMEAKL